VSDSTGANLPQEQPAKTTLFAGGNEADVRKMAGAPSPQAIFPID
jgi:hypothetical protein